MPHYAAWRAGSNSTRYTRLFAYNEAMATMATMAACGWVTVGIGVLVTRELCAKQQAVFSLDFR